MSTAEVVTRAAAAYLAGTAIAAYLLGRWAPDRRASDTEAAVALLLVLLWPFTLVVAVPVLFCVAAFGAGRVNSRRSKAEKPKEVP